MAIPNTFYLYVQPYKEFGRDFSFKGKYQITLPKVPNTTKATYKNAILTWANAYFSFMEPHLVTMHIYDKNGIEIDEVDTSQPREDFINNIVCRRILDSEGPNLIDSSLSFNEMTSPDMIKTYAARPKLG